MTHKPITVEVEDKEMAIKSSKGVLAVIPKEKVKWVKEMISKGQHARIDEYIRTLPEA